MDVTPIANELGPTGPTTNVEDSHRQDEVEDKVTRSLKSAGNGLFSKPVPSHFINRTLSYIYYLLTKSDNHGHP